MRKTRSKLIIKTRKGGFTKIYANGKWQKKVYNINFNAVAHNGINIKCKFDKYKTDKNGVLVYNQETLQPLVEHCVVKI